MSEQNSTTSEDRPEYIEGDVLEIFDPHSNSYVWIEVEEVFNVANSQILLALGRYFCACWARTESLATPQRNGAR